MPNTPAPRVYPENVLKLLKHCDGNVPHTAYLMGVSATTVYRASVKKESTGHTENKARVALHRIRMKQAAPAKSEPAKMAATKAGCNRVILMSIPENKIPMVNKVMKILEVPMEELT